MHDRDRDRDVEERASVEDVERDAGRAEEPSVVRLEILVVRPVEKRQGKPALPGQHHRIALHELEQGTQHRFGEGRGAREAVEVGNATGSEAVAGRPRYTSSAGR